LKPIILHIPHSSTYIPFHDGFISNYVNNEVLMLTDWYTEELFYSEDAITIPAHFSRIFCDVERFADDDKEIMANQGMGFLYTHTDDGVIFREVTDELRLKIYKDYYKPHHDKLTAAVQAQLNTLGFSTIVDCHSFSENPFKRDLNKNMPRPDICIGTDNYHTPNDLI
jgi:N-formylglutamate deformylase